MNLRNLLTNAALAPLKKQMKALGITDLSGALTANADAVKAKLKDMGIKDPDAFLAQHGASFLKQMDQEPSKAKA